MHRSEPSRLQSLALQLADKVINLVDSNERIFEMKQGKKNIQFYWLEKFAIILNEICVDIGLARTSGEFRTSSKY